MWLEILYVYYLKLEKFYKNHDENSLAKKKNQLKKVKELHVKSVKQPFWFFSSPYSKSINMYKLFLNFFKPKTH